MSSQCPEAIGYQQALASYHRCEAAGDLFGSFYEIFFAKSLEIPPLFAKTDMERQKQEAMASCFCRSMSVLANKGGISSDLAKKIS